MAEGPAIPPSSCPIQEKDVKGKKRCVPVPLISLHGMLYDLDLDIQIRKHTEDSIARRTPAIQQLAARYNSICLRLQNHLLQKVHSTVGLPTPLDVDQLFNTEANPEMWLETGLDEDDPIQHPQYLYDDAVKSGISAMLMKDQAEEEQYQ